MREIFYIKTFAGRTNIEYRDKFVRITIKHILLGIGFLVVAVAFILENPSSQQLAVVSLCIGILILGFIVSYVRVRKLQSDIEMGISQGKNTIETKYGYDGTGGWFPFSVLGAIIFSILISKITNGWNLQNALYSVLLSFGAGYILAIGLTYFYWEQKFNRTIMVYGYNKVKKQKLK